MKEALNFGLILVKVDRDAVNTVTLISGSIEAFSFKDVAQVTAAVLASDLNTLHAPTPV